MKPHVVSQSFRSILQIKSSHSRLVLLRIVPPPLFGQATLMLSPRQFGKFPILITVKHTSEHAFYTRLVERTLNLFLVKLKGFVNFHRLKSKTKKYHASLYVSFTISPLLCIQR